MNWYFCFIFQPNLFNFVLNSWALFKKKQYTYKQKQYIDSYYSKMSQSSLLCHRKGLVAYICGAIEYNSWWVLLVKEPFGTFALLWLLKPDFLENWKRWFTSHQLAFFFFFEMRVWAVGRAKAGPWSRTRESGLCSAEKSVLDLNFKKTTL